MTYRIGKRFRFMAAHHLPDLPEEHKCRRPHGHTYDVELVLSAAECDSWWMVRDYGDLKEFREYIDGTLDHRDLNEVLVCTTAEFIAEHLFCLAREHYGGQVERVRVSESMGETWAEYEG